MKLRHIADNILYHRLLRLDGVTEQDNHFANGNRLCPRDLRRLQDMVEKDLKKIAKPIIERLESEGYSFGPPYRLFDDDEINDNAA
jgi:hypothetical protein